MAGLISSIKEDVKKQGTSKGKFFYLRQDGKARIRFLNDMDDGYSVTFHDSFQQGINVPCQEQFGRECPFCEMEGLRTRQQYVWSVYDYDANDVKLFMFPVNNCSPVPPLMALYETYGTIVDRDYVVSTSGRGTEKSYTVVPMDKAKFRNQKAKAISETKMLDIVDKAYPAESDEEEEKPKRKAPNAKAAGKAAKPNTKKAAVDDYDEADEDDKATEAEYDYTEMTAKELYLECKNRGLKVEQRKPQKYYITILEDDDRSKADWDELENASDDDEWEDEDE